MYKPGYIWYKYSKAIYYFYFTYITKLRTVLPVIEQERKMRKRAAMALCIILALSAIPSTQGVFAGAAEDSIVRVKLSVGTTAALSFFVDGNYTAGDSSAAIERDQYTVKLENGSLNMYCGSRKICGGVSIKLTRHEATGGRNNFI